MPQFFLPTASLAPRSLTYAMRTARMATFDGVEVLLGPKVNSRKVRDLAREFGLKLRLHEVWTLEDDSTHLHNKLAAALGIIPRYRGELRNQLFWPIDEPVVCFPHRHKEIDWLGVKRPGLKDRLLLQTTRQRSNSVSYEEFLTLVHDGGFKVVFDTFHILELIFGVTGVEGLRYHRPEDLRLGLIGAWDELEPHVVEIHLADINPRLGHSVGENLFPGEGVLDLPAFARHVRSRGWDGIVTPEVTPRHLFAAPLLDTQLGIPFEPRVQDLYVTTLRMFG